MKINIARTALVLAATAFAAGTALAQGAALWEIGPIENGRTDSVGMPPSPIPAGRGWFFEFPYPVESAGHVHYVTFDPGSLAGKTRLVVRYQVDVQRGGRFIARATPADPATVSLYFQRRGDNWSGRRAFEFFRWYAPGPTVRELAAGRFEMTARLDDGGWVSVMGRPARDRPAAFSDALVNAGRVGLVFGSAGARGHGVFATAPARFTLISFDAI